LTPVEFVDCANGDDGILLRSVLLTSFLKAGARSPL